MRLNIILELDKPIRSRHIKQEFAFTCSKSIGLLPPFGNSIFAMTFIRIHSMNNANRELDLDTTVFAIACYWACYGYNCDVFWV